MSEPASDEQMPHAPATMDAERPADPAEATERGETPEGAEGEMWMRAMAVMERSLDRLSAKLTAAEAERDELRADFEAQGRANAKDLTVLGAEMFKDRAERDGLRRKVAAVRVVCDKHAGCGDECSAVEEITALLDGGES